MDRKQLTFLFTELGKPFTRTSRHKYVSHDIRRFKSFFGISVQVCAHAWIRLRTEIHSAGRPIHLLWALLFLKTYGFETVNSRLAEVDEKNVSHMVVELYWSLKFLSSRTEAKCLVFVDGSDFSINEPSPFSPRWYSNKLNGPGLRYEPGISFYSGHLVWANGPYPCGLYPELKIFQGVMKKRLENDEFVVADGGYKDDRCRKKRRKKRETRLYAVIRARHESANRRMKHFKVLSSRFRYHRSLHSACFHAVENVIQLSIQNEEPLFKVYDLKV